MEYKIFNDISKSEKKSRKIIFFSITSVLLIAIAAMHYVYKTNESVKNSFYLIDGGQKVATIRVKDFRKAVDILTEGHISLFHQLFFSIEPDWEYIKRNIEEKALYMIDRSGTKVYNDLLNDNYFESVVMSRYRIEVEMDSMNIDYSKYPYKFMFHGKQKIFYKRDITYRKLITKGYIEETAVSPNNLNGMKIIDWSIVNNDDISKN
ncbi:Bacteroides conjugative transposon TraK protein [Tenacibaculum sp. MAR_2009_124]|uniref:hypothetical protein n=1 Tax=Tenacibaculum sp. MAR_2009_124 TaxID=1250059 RepID=UPI000895CD5E|nr:hypothetical protein [Tenacibaculum sp. MAR_2009_124]SEC65515.1 Bacteroides conjugative transposon TraK protein [Tenacibaculum sp. MAR_2009_124]